MIKVCIIEDEPQQFQAIKDSLTEVNDILKDEGKTEYSFGTLGIECWKHSPTDFEKLYASIRPDLIVLDHDLGWGEDREPWNGDGVLKRIDEIHNNKDLPFIIVTSDKLFEDASETKNILSVFVRKPSKEVFRRELIRKQYFTNPELIDDLEELVLSCLKTVQLSNPSITFTVYDYPKEDIYENRDDFNPTAHRSLKDQDGRHYGTEPLHKMIHPSLFYQKHIICIFVSKYDYCIIHVVDGEPIIHLINFDGQFAIKDLRRKMKERGLNKLTQEPGIIFNPDYIQKVGKKYQVEGVKVTRSLKRKLRELLTYKLKEVYKKNSEYAGSLRDDIREISPFSPQFEKFFSNEEIDQWLRK